MNSKNSIPQVASLIFGLAVLAFPFLANANSCWLHFNADADYAKRNSDVIFIGTAVDKWTETFDSLDPDVVGHISAERTVFDVESIIKGEVKADKELLVEKGRQCSCAGKFKVGKKYLVHASYEKDEGGRLILNFCDFNKEIE